MYSKNKPKTALMKNQRFVIVPAFCQESQRHGFKFVDTEEELGETDIFHTMNDSLYTFNKFIGNSTEKNVSIEFLINSLYKEFFEVILDQIVFLPIPPVHLTAKSGLELIENTKHFYETTLNLKQISKVFLEWASNLCQKTTIFAPEDFSSNSCVYILVGLKEVPTADEIKEKLAKVRGFKSKQQARLFLEKCRQDEEITGDDYLFSLSKVNNLENLPEQTPEEKLAELSKQN